MQYKFFLDNDSSNFFGSVNYPGTMTEDIESSIEKAVSECPDVVTTYLLSAKGGKCYYPTRVAEVIGSEALQRAHRQGKDPFGMFIDALKRSGKETFLTLRMNEVHYADDPDYPGKSEFNKTHPEFIVDPEGAKINRTGNIEKTWLSDWMAYCLDYSFSEVRQYVLSIVRELTELYVFDGLSLDWFRFPRYLSGTPEEVWGKRDIMTQFMSDVRNILESTGRKIILTARVPASLDGCRTMGFDILQWTRMKLVDSLIVTNYFNSDFYMPIRDMKKAMGPDAVPIYACIELYHNRHLHCPESLRAAAAGLYGSGADGLYLFNFACWEEFLAERPYHWLEDMKTPEAAGRKPLLFSVSHSLNRITGVDLPGQLPRELEPGQQAEVGIVLPAAVLPAKRALFLVYSFGDIKLMLNNRVIPEMKNHRRTRIFAEHRYYDTGDREDYRVFQIDPAILTEENSITIENTSPQRITIELVNLGLW